MGWDPALCWSGGRGRVVVKGELRIGGPEMCVGGCFMVPGAGPSTSEIAATGRARATGKGREGEI